MTIEDQLMGKTPEAPEAGGVDPQPEQAAQRMKFDFSFLKTETGPGEISDYLDDPLNFSNSRGMAQILRGLYGFGLNTKKAVIDILVGLLRFSKERKAADASQTTHTA